MTAKKIKLQEVISEIPVADAASESGAEARDVEDDFEEEEEGGEGAEGDDDNKPQQKSNHRLQQMVDYQPGDHRKEGTQILILLSVQQKL